MNENTQEIFPDWGDLDDGKESVWGADWVIDLDQDKSTVVVTVSYKNREEWLWSYTDIKKAFDEKTVKEFAQQYITEEISEEDIKELTDFFFHWLMTVEGAGNTDFEINDEDVIELSIPASNRLQ
jgi:hypothetical protein